ncbi:Cytochrome oxidase assembly [Exophiala dermatitidis]|nr:Cytochrome oxidase assembly [Exophiala dermatitidis]KAJ4560069.1 Cytochrome oxidase assembly [Exophiala dermatitidis]
MAIFQSKPFRSSRTQGKDLWERLSAIYRQKIAKNPFLFFGLPFMSLMVGASFLLTPAAALRYEKHDRKNRQLTDSEKLELGLKGGVLGEGNLTYNPRRRKVLKGELNERDEYYRLMAKDLDNWEQKRVERLKGEPDGRLHLDVERPFTDFRGPHYL